MSLNRSNNIAIIDIDKGCMKSNVSHEQPTLSNSRRYNIKKSVDLTDEHTNQNNTLYGDTHHYRHKVPTDLTSKSRYKSYDYLSSKRPPANQYQSSPYCRYDAYNDCSDSAGDNREDLQESHQKFRKSYSYGGLKYFSSNEELDNTHNHDFEINQSSDSSYNFQYKPDRYPENHDKYHRTPRRTKFQSNKYYADSWNYDHINKYTEPKKSLRYSPPPRKFNKSPDSSHIKHSLRRTSYPSYLNNNRSDTSPRKTNNPHLSSDLRNSRYSEINNDNYSAYRKEVPNRNMLSLKSTYRKNENIPHSGTRLESHRKNLDKYCTGKPRGTRFDEPNSCENNLPRRNSLATTRSNKPFRSNLRHSPMYSASRKKYDNVNNSVDGKYSSKEKFKTPRRPLRDPGSDDESCYFENCHNTNNDSVSKYNKSRIKLDKDHYASHSDDLSSSSIILSQEKPTESVALSVSSPKINPNIKSLHSTLNRNNTFGEHFKMPPPQAYKCFHFKESTNRNSHPNRMSKNRSNHK